MSFSDRRAHAFLYLLCISAFLASLTQNIYSPILPLLRDSFHVSLSSINLTVSVFMLILAVMQIVLGPVLDAKGGKIVLIPSIVISMIGAAGCALTTNFTLFFICRILQALGIAAIPLVASTTIGHRFTGIERGSAMSTYQTLLALAPAVSPVLGGFLGQAGGYQGIFLFLFFISFLLLILNLFYFPGSTKQSQTESAGSGVTLRLYFTVLRHKWGQVILTAGFLHFFIYFAFLVGLPVLLTDHYQLPLQFVGLLYVPVALSTMLGSHLFKIVQSKMDIRKLFIGGTFFVAGCVLLFAITAYLSIFLLAAASFLYGIGAGLTLPAHTTLLANEFEENRGTAMGLYNFIRYTGMAAGPVISSFLLNWLTYSLQFVVFAFVFASILFVLWRRIPKKQAGIE